mmetsp:Transcript_101673/g.285007  ORF Transcript_101673/g.285007 Transcript_101673/m.285007 type:complete len:224 (+) Transcript_101673:245-916(+)
MSPTAARLPITPARLSKTCSATRLTHNTTTNEIFGKLAMCLVQLPARRPKLRNILGTRCCPNASRHNHGSATRRTQAAMGARRQGGKARRLHSRRNVRPTAWVDNTAVDKEAVTPQKKRPPVTPRAIGDAPKIAKHVRASAAVAQGKHHGEIAAQMGRSTRRCKATTAGCRSANTMLGRSLRHSAAAHVSAIPIATLARQPMPIAHIAARGATPTITATAPNP